MKYVNFLVLFLVCSSAYSIEPYNCRNGAFPSYKDVGLAKVNAQLGEKVNFRDDGEGCPNDGKCIEKAYLVGGDEVLIANQGEGWTCVWHFGKAREFVGWMPSKNIEIQEIPESTSNGNWLGKWKAHIDSNIHITAGKNGNLHVSGTTLWHGGKKSYNEEVVHLGDFEGDAKTSGDRMKYKSGDDSYDCVVNFRLLSKYMVVDDNGNCGGINVRFNDVYRKMP